MTDAPEGPSWTEFVGAALGYALDVKQTWMVNVEFYTGVHERLDVPVLLPPILVFFAIDIVWLSVISKNLYAAQLGHLMAPKVNWLAAILFYLV
ncbi:MAG: DUF2177 family protein, partial [Gaiellaceae bacterium]